MIPYPTIEWRPVRGASYIYTFDKIDGSNVRAEWTRKKGFSKFGRRNGLLDHSIPVLLEAPDLIREKYDDMGAIFSKMRIQKAVAFFEFWGPGSFAGVHVDEPHTVTLFDVYIPDQGILEPKVFLKHFDGVDHASLLHQGKFNNELEEKIRSGTLPGMTFEGVVCKGGYTRPGLPLMFKVKTAAWLDRLRARCAGDDKLFEQLR